MCNVYVRLFAHAARRDFGVAGELRPVSVPPPRQNNMETLWLKQLFICSGNKCGVLYSLEVSIHQKMLVACWAGSPHSWGFPLQRSFRALHCCD